jgi:ribonuclease HI
MDVYTDGSCINNGHKDNTGGWAYIIKLTGDGIVKGHGPLPRTSSNRAEATAVLMALSSDAIPKDEQINLYTDSQYVIRGLEKLAAKKYPASHKDLWIQIHVAVAGRHIQAHHVRAHTGDALNTMCDRLAYMEAKLIRHIL